jgi:pimeloyl-ACP methyl ester carboxylesterase
VALKGADGVTLRGWYVPSRNGAAVLALHGTGSNRLGVARHARLLAGHGYGVLALDLRGHGESGGRSTSVPWRLDDDLDAALDWLEARPDVHGGRIGALGVSLGGEVALQLAARRTDLRAVVAEGVMGGPVADARGAHLDPASLVQIGALAGVTSLLAGGGPPAPDADLVARVAPRPLLLISSGRSSEAAEGRAFARRGGASTALWNLPGASHGGALGTDPAGYEQRVVGFLDRALR